MVAGRARSLPAARGRRSCRKHTDRIRALAPVFFSWLCFGAMSGIAARAPTGSIMPKRILALLLVATALLTAGAPSVTFAAGGGHLLIARRGGGEAGVSLNDAVQQVQRETGGRVLSADTVNQVVGRCIASRC